VKQQYSLSCRFPTTDRSESDVSISSCTLRATWPYIAPNREHQPQRSRNR
jgi:hypothetical protein